MEKATDWARLWRELIETRERGHRERGMDQLPDRWRHKARNFDALVKRRWARPDSSRDFLVARVAAQPGASVLDIGAGTGAWAITLAQHASRVTAVEPSPAMVEIMQENLAQAGVSNVTVVRAEWPDVDVPPHDFTLCSHAMYGCADLPAFVRRMVEVTRRTCFLIIRIPGAGGIMEEAAMRVWGHPHDSANFQVAYNVLLQMGIYPNVLMEDTGMWDPWSHASLEEALDEAKHRLGLGQTGVHDAFLTDLLQRRLEYVDGRYVWPRAARSALVYWDVEGGQ